MSKSDYVLVSKQWLSGLQAEAALAKKNLDDSECLSPLDKATAGLVMAPLQGYIASAPSLIEWQPVCYRVAYAPEFSILENVEQDPCVI
jgi:hypothetical protein